MRWTGCFEEFKEVDKAYATATDSSNRNIKMVQVNLCMGWFA